MQEPFEDVQADERQIISPFAMARRWGEQTLELTRDPTQATVLQRFLELLENAEFVPTEAAIEAYSLLSCTDEETFSQTALPPQYQLYLQSHTNKLMDGFRETFFYLSPKVRQRDWNALRLLVDAIPETKQRLLDLQPALALESLSIATSGREFMALCQGLQHLALASPTQRPVLRRQFVAQIRETKWALAPLVADFRRHHSDWCAVDPEFLRILAGERPAAPPLPLDVHPTTQTTSPWRTLSSVLVIAVALVRFGGLNN